MPIYEYECEACGDVSSEMKNVSDRSEPEKIPCAKCGGKITQKIGAVGFLYRGVGSPKPSGEFRELMQGYKKKNPLGRYDY